MKIQLKRSNVLENGSAKEPTQAQMEYGEIAVNYSNSDPVLFIKDETNSIIRIAGAGAPGGFDGDYNSLTNKPTIGDGEITIKQGGVSVGTFTVNQVGPTDIDLSEGALYTAGDGLNLNGTEFKAVAQVGYGIDVEAAGIRIGDNWSNIPALPA